jgi:hypothetical protein
MALFGFRPPKGAFGTPMMPDRQQVGPFGGFGMDGGAIDESGAINPQRLAAISGKPKKRGIFGSGVGLGDVAGVVGDAILQNNGDAPLWAPMRMQRMQSEQMGIMDQAKREADFADWRRKQDYERVNPKTTSPYRWEGNDGDVYELGQDGKPFRIFDDPTPKMNFIPDGMGGGQWVPMPGAQVTPSKPVGKLTPIGGGQPAGPVPFANAPPQRLESGVMTSGRRTSEGNKLVGGVPGSKHLTGEAVDYSGPDLNALLAEVRKLPGLRRAFIHNDNHVHTEGDWNAPYFGKRGTIGQR